MRLETELSIVLTDLITPIVARCVDGAIDRIKLPQQLAAPVDEVLTVEQAAKLLNLSRQTVYGLVSDRKIPFCKPTGSQLYFLRSDLIEWLKKHRTATVAEQTDQYEQNQPPRRNRATAKQKTA